MNDAERMMQVFLGPNSSSTENPRADGPHTFVEGVVKEVTADGIELTVPSWDSGTHRFGPYPYPRWAGAITGPQAGDACLILFPASSGDADSARPWVIGWWPS